MPREVYNPIDTFPHKHKLSGDYIQDKRNFVSVRDGKKANRILFFVHFEKKDGCAGEIKGEAVLAKPDRAFYRQSGDPCELELTFSGNKVTLREEKGCGNYRDIKCVFEGSFSKKKEDIRKPVKKPPVKKWVFQYRPGWGVSRRRFEMRSKNTGIRQNAKSRYICRDKPEAAIYHG